MTRHRSIQIISIAFAVLAMAISAIAACACTHHQPGKTEEKTLSCHAATHEAETPEISQDDPSRSRVYELCNCYVNRVQPAITAKSEQKKSKSQQTEVENNAGSIEIDDQQISIGEVGILRSDHILYTKLLPRSGPSRAPPRR